VRRKILTLNKRESLDEGRETELKLHRLLPTQGRGRRRGESQKWGTINKEAYKRFISTMRRAPAFYLGVKNWNKWKKGPAGKNIGTTEGRT